MRIVLLAALLSVSPVVAAAAPPAATKTTAKTASKPAATATHAPARATPPASAAPGAAAKPGGPRTSVLANGMHVVIAPDSSAATVDVSLWFPAGSRDERAGKTGLTQVVNGLLFAGSRHYPPGEHQRLIDREGGTTGVFALADFASVNETVPPASLELALRLEADRMAAANLDAPSLEAVRAAIERSRRDPSTRSGVALGVRKLYETAFQGHSYRWPAAGLDADLAKLTLEDARTWWRDRYGPDGTWLVISGRCDPDSAEALARRTLGAVPKRGAARAAVAPPPAQSGARRSRGTLEGAGRVLLVGWRTSGARSADAAAMNVLDALLTHRRPSRIEGSLIADSSRFLAVQAGFDQRRDAGMLYVAVLTDVDADSLQLEREVIRAVEHGAAAASDDDLDGALRQYQVESLFASQTPAGAGSAMGRAAMLTGSPSAAAALDSARRLTPAALRQSAARQLTAAHRTVVWMLPGSPPGAASGAPESASGARKGGR